MRDSVVVVSVARTPMGSFQGSLSGLAAWELGACAIKSAVHRSGIASDQVDEVVMGCVLPAGQGQAPARQATLAADLPSSVVATTVNKMCGSGMRAMMFAHDSLISNSARVVVAGGMESMTNAPYLIPKARSGYRLGHSMMYDHLMLDGLEDAYQKGRSMGTFGEECADKYGFTRAQQDQYAIDSVKAAQKAIEDGTFSWEIAPVTIKNKKGQQVILADESPQKINVEKIAHLQPVFKKDGTITAASSSSISDGAAAVVMMLESTANILGVEPLARVVGHATWAQSPNWFSTAPIGAIIKLLGKNGWDTHDVDLWEINEAFAVVPMAAIHDLKIDREKVNVHGGACALGHPIGASGARIVVTLINALRKHNMKRGVATLCIGGGEATAIGLEMI